MKNILGCICFCAVGVGIMALISKLVSSIWGDNAAGFTYFSIVFGLMWIFKITANFQWGQRLGKVEKLNTTSFIKSLNSTIVLVYVVCFFVGSDTMLGMVIHDFVKIPSFAGMVIIYTPIYIGYRSQKNKTKHSEVKAQIQDSVVPDENILAPALPAATTDNAAVSADDKVSERPKVKGMHVLGCLAMALVGYFIQAHEPTMVNKAGFYFFLTCAAILLISLIYQRKKNVSI